MSVKTFALVVLLASANMAIGASTSGSDDRSKSKYSLKNLNKFSKNYSLSSLHLNHINNNGFTHLNSVAGTSFVGLQKGNTTYVFPYKYNIKVPRFKTPTPPQQ